MAFPVIESLYASPHAGAATSTTITLPSGVQAGDLLLMVFGKRGGVAPTRSGATWTQHDSEVVDTFVWSGLFSRIATGDDVVTFTHGENVAASYVVLRISGQHATSAPLWAKTSGWSAAPNPVALDTSAWAGEDKLHITALTFGEWPALQSWPAMAANNRNIAGSTASWGSRTAVATWNSTANSQDPEAFGLEFAFGFVAWTIAIRPPAAPIVPGPPTIGTASAGNLLVSVPFTPPAANGGPEPTSYTATLSPGGLTKSGASSPIVFTGDDGIVNGTTYTATVTATNSNGTGTASAASNPVTPAAVMFTATLEASVPNTGAGVLLDQPFVWSAWPEGQAGAMSGKTVVDGVGTTHPTTGAATITLPVGGAWVVWRRFTGLGSPAEDIQDVTAA